MTNYIVCLLTFAVLTLIMTIIGIVLIGKDLKKDSDNRGIIFFVGIVCGVFLTMFVIVEYDRTLCSIQDVLNDNVTWEYKIVDGEKIDSILVRKK